MTDEDALSRLDELRRQRNIDVCSDLEIHRSGLLVVEEKLAGDYSAEYLHSMLDFLLDLGYWPSWREWVVAQLTALILDEDLREVRTEQYADNFPEHWDGLERKATAARTNETIWKTLESLCGLALPTPVPQSEPPATPAPKSTPAPTPESTPTPSPLLVPHPAPTTLDTVRDGLTNVRRHYHLDLCEELKPATVSGVYSVNALASLQLLGANELFEFLLDLGYRPSWREWVLAQYQAAPDDSQVWPEDAPERWLNYDQKARVAQTNEAIWELLGDACAGPARPRRTVDLTSAILEDAQSRLDDLRRRYSIDICGDLEMYGSGFLVVESKVIADYRPDAETRVKVIGGHTDEAVHAMLDFLVDLGYRPSWRDWVIAQRTAGLHSDIKERNVEYYEERWSDTEGWGSLPSKALAAQTNEALWENVRGLCST